MWAASKGPRRARPPDNGGGQVGELLGQEPEGEHEDHGRAVGVHSRARIAQGEEEEELDGDDYADRPHGQARDPRRGQWGGLPINIYDTVFCIRFRCIFLFNLKVLKIAFSYLEMYYAHNAR